MLFLPGVRMKWKIPLGYFFSSNQAPANILKQLIDYIIRQLKAIGVHVVATVCDQAASNVKAMQLLGYTPEKPFFYCDGQKIPVFFDIPHIGKRVAASFRRHDLEFAPERVATLKHIEEMYKISKQLMGTRIAHKVTPLHIYAKNRNSMRVYLALQLLSHSVASAIYTLVAKNLLPQNAVFTAEWLELFDQFIDSFNGGKYWDAKELRSR
jgi:hypothetical protein